MEQPVLFYTLKGVLKTVRSLQKNSKTIKNQDIIHFIPIDII